LGGFGEKGKFSQNNSFKVLKKGFSFLSQFSIFGVKFSSSFPLPFPIPTENIQIGTLKF